MKKILSMAAAALVLAACTTSDAHRCVNPLPAGYSADSLNECTVPAQFTIADFDWKAGTLAMTVFSEDLYDAVELKQLKPGDTLVYQGRSIVVAKVNEDKGYMIINDGIENEGADLLAGEGGTYRGIQLDDHSVYTELGQVTVPLASELVLIDCGVEPTDPVDTIRANVPVYIQQLKGGRDDFSELNTQVIIQNGKITQIARRWIP